MKGELEILKLMRGMLTTFLTLYDNLLDQDVREEEDALPIDVKEGQFAVHTLDDDTLRRSVVELSSLSDPRFLKLLERAEQEFGFGQMGILVIPCTHNHLHSVIGRK